MLLAVSTRPWARLLLVVVVPWTSSSEICAAGQPVLAEIASRTKRVSVAGKLIFTVFPAPGSNEYVAELVMVEKLVPSALPCTASVSVRAPQPAGSFSTISSMLVLLPRSTWTHCGRELLELSQ